MANITSIFDSDYHYNNTALNGVHFLGGNVTMRNCIFDSNNATLGDGIIGATKNIGGMWKITNCSFIKNQAKRYGGALYVNAPISIVVEKSVFIQNRGDYGGAIYILSSRNTTIHVGGIAIKGNRATMGVLDEPRC